ncbi:MAG: hypothetical protein NT029_09055 [Armatimonadetes bacterium]|nr:hypothetical protein [Armatimonadota bacterium]
MNFKTSTYSISRAAGLAAALVGLAGIARADKLDYSNGFAGQNSLTLTQASPSGYTWQPVQSGALVLTEDPALRRNALPHLRSSAFSTKQLAIGKFSTMFRFRMSTTATHNLAYGITFCLQTSGPNALGGPGSGLGYGPDNNGGGLQSISKSVAVRFAVDNVASSKGVSLTGLLVNGASVDGGISLASSGIDFNSGNIYEASIDYDAVTLRVKVTDLKTSASSTRSYTVDVAKVVGGQTAHVGFTGGAGAFTAQQLIGAWKFDSSLVTPAVTQVAVSPSVVLGGDSAEGTVRLKEPVSTDTEVKLTTTTTTATVPTTVVVPAGSTTQTFPVTTTPVATTTTDSVTASVAGTSTKGSVTLSPVGVGSVQIDHANVSINYLPEGKSAVGTITLQAIAKAGPVTVTLTSAVPGVATVPSTVTVPQGAQTVDFPILTYHVDINTPSLITAVANGSRRTTTLTVRPLRVNSVDVTTTTLKGGAGSAASITLEAPAPTAGVTINLSSNYACLQLPASVFVPAGATTAQFRITTSAVTKSTLVLVTASSRTNNVYSKITVTP